MSITPARNDRDDASHPNLRALLDRPLHAVEFKNRKHQRDLWSDAQQIGLLPSSFPKRKLHPIIGDKSNPADPNLGPRGDIKLLSNFRPHYARKMSSMFAHQGGGVFGRLVGDPAAARHGNSAQLSVLSFQ